MKIIGLMSGTSVDGLDIALCEITGQPPQLEAKIVIGEIVPYEGHTLNLSDEDIIATLTTLTVISIAQAYDDFIAHKIDDIIIGGGGARNPFLMQQLKTALPQSDILMHEHNVTYEQATLKLEKANGNLRTVITSKD